MAANDLHDPLGIDGPPPGVAGRDLPWGLLALGGIAALGAGLFAFGVLTDNGMGGRPFADTSIERPAQARVPALPPPPAEQARNAEKTPASSSGAPAGAAGRVAASIVETESGVRVVRQGGGEAPAALILQVPPDPLGVQLAAAPDPRLVEKGRFGSLPRIGSDGARPSEVYARPLVTSPALKPEAPQIALVLGGMGLNPVATSAAVQSLPGAVTMGFAPYGADLETQVAHARDEGHEVILQVPMEPFDRADIPGPHTLLSGAEPAQNLEHLRWLMSRMTGYIGVANFLGAKFTGRADDLSPVLREVASRGLIYFDDGTSSQSLAASLAPGLGSAAVRADVVIDATPRSDAIDAALNRLESLARSKGVAIGYAAGLPGAIDPIARFARGLEKRGIALVPLSVAVGRSAGPTAGLAQ